MCGIWGFDVSKSGMWDEDFVEDMIKRADERGGHSYGFYGIKANGEHIYFKEEGRARPLLIMELIKDCVVVIGQSRLATSGGIDLFNAQPLVTKDYAIVHNGNIENYKAIMEYYKYRPTTELDTEALVPVMRSGDEINVKGSYLALKLEEYEWVLKYYTHGLPLVQARIELAPDVINEYFCSKEWRIQS